jgi:putative aminopeptidase FrvX
MKIEQLNADKKLFIKNLMPLFSVYSTPNNEDEMREYLRKQLKNIKNVDFDFDTTGNIIGERNLKQQKKVILNSHMDSWMNPVTPEYKKSLGYYPKKDMITNPNFMIGCDDKVGISIILYLLKYTNLDFKFIFTYCEEKGCVGVNALHESVYDNSHFVVTLDRANSGDIIQTYADRKMMSNEMAEKISILSESKYKVAQGIFADTYYMSKHLPAFNMSIGYYNQHRRDDYVIVSEAMNAMQLTYNLILNQEDVAVNAYPEIINEKTNDFLGLMA